MSLPVEPAFSTLRSDFVVGWRNIIEERFVGESFGYSCDQTSVGTTNGAGPHNVQIFVLAPDLTVLHALPGFWHPEDLTRELRFAQRLHELWKDDSKDRATKDLEFRRMQLAELRDHPRTMTLRSGWQGFDAANERKRIAAGQQRDTMLLPSTNRGARISRKDRPRMKPINQLVHERMAARPFVSFHDFDTATFADYGRVFYDNNKKVDGKGEIFMTPRRVAKAEKKAARIRRAEEARAARRARSQQRAAEREKRRAASRAKRAKRAKRSGKSTRNIDV